MEHEQQNINVLLAYHSHSGKHIEPPMAIDHDFSPYHDTTRIILGGFFKYVLLATCSETLTSHQLSFTVRRETECTFI